MNQLTLTVLAAGMGSRYGGLKQLDPVGQSGQTMLDYAVEDALRAGFSKVVFVIRKDFETVFREQIGSRYTERMKVCYSFQSLDDIPGGYKIPTGRSKPWGTAHAVLAARDVIEEPFAVINADDFYGRAAYESMARHLSEQPCGKLALSMVGYPLRNTLSPHGTVNRGICNLKSDHSLASVEEYTEISVDKDGILRGNSMEGERTVLEEQSSVSMNFWGFTPEIFDLLEKHFSAFIKSRGNELKSECYLPSVVDALINDEGYSCPVLQVDSPWFGVTYPDDKARVVDCIRKLTESGLYDA